MKFVKTALSGVPAVAGSTAVIAQDVQPRPRTNGWGYDRGGVWVNRGCRAEFEIRR